MGTVAIGAVLMISEEFSNRKRGGKKRREKRESGRNKQEEEREREREEGIEGRSDVGVTVYEIKIRPLQIKKKKTSESQTMRIQ